MAQTSQQIVDEIVEGIKVVDQIAADEKAIMPYAQFAASLIPGIGTAVAAIGLAQPYIDKIAEYAPQISDLVEKDGLPVVDAIRKVGPDVMSNLKIGYSILAKADPTLPTVAPEQVSDVVAAAFFQGLFERSFFKPQDPEFEKRGNPSTF